MLDIFVTGRNVTDYFWVHYFLESTISLERAAYDLAVGQSFGNPSVRSKWETDEMIKAHSAVINIPQTSSKNNKSGDVWIGFPYANIDFTTDGISQLLCFLMGGQLDIDHIVKCHVLEVEVDPLKGDFFYPEHGITGLRERVKSFRKPLFGGILKPKTGASVDILLEMTKQLLDGGCDFIKEDEILGNPEVCDWLTRVEVISDYINKHNYKCIYTFCINSDPFDLKDRVFDAKGCRAPGIHVNFWSGLGIYKAIRKLDTKLFIHYQKSGDKILTNRSHDFHIDWRVLCYLASISGVDSIHAGMWGGGYASNDTDEMHDIFKILQKRNVIPTLSCGMNPDIVPKIVEEFGVDWMANVGGFIHGDPDGTLAGALKMRKAVDRIAE